MRIVNGPKELDIGKKKREILDALYFRYEKAIL
jgi:hypothetical protein